MQVIDRWTEEPGGRVGIRQAAATQQMRDDWLESQGTCQPIDRGLIDRRVLPDGRYHAQYAASTPKSRSRRPISRNF